jgi:hypothetical protein
MKPWMKPRPTQSFSASKEEEQVSCIYEYVSSHFLLQKIKFWQMQNCNFDILILSVPHLPRTTSKQHSSTFSTPEM